MITPRGGRVAAAGQGSVVGQRLGDAHADRRPERGGEPDQERGARTRQVGGRRRSAPASRRSRRSARSGRAGRPGADAARRSPPRQLSSTESTIASLIANGLKIRMPLEELGYPDDDDARSAARPPTRPGPPQALRAAGYRVTSQRLLIHQTLVELDRHVRRRGARSPRSSERLPNVSLPTVYASLDALEEAGLVRRVAAGRGRALYDSRPVDHHHLVCRRCGAVEDLDAARAAGRAPSHRRGSAASRSTAPRSSSTACARAARRAPAERSPDAGDRAARCAACSDGTARPARWRAPAPRAVSRMLKAISGGSRQAAIESQVPSAIPRPSDAMSRPV